MLWYSNGTDKNNMTTDKQQLADLTECVASLVMTNCQYKRLSASQWITIDPGQRPFAIKRNAAVGLLVGICCFLQVELRKSL